MIVKSYIILQDVSMLHNKVFLHVTPILLSNIWNMDHFFCVSGITNINLCLN